MTITVILLAPHILLVYMLKMIKETIEGLISRKTDSIVSGNTPNESRKVFEDL